MGKKGRRPVPTIFPRNSSLFTFNSSLSRRGFTLVELLVALSIMGIIGGVNGAVLEAGFQAWNHTQGRIAIQQVANELMEVLLEGGYDEEGLRDAVELRAAEMTSVSFVPLWTDRSHVPNPVTNKTQVFTLEKHVKAGAATPVGQVRKAGSDEWASVPVRFDYGAGKDPKRPDDVVTFTDPIPAGASLKVIYTPDADVHPETQTRFWWNTEAGDMSRSYAGKTGPMYARMQGVKVDRLAFLYYDNLNRLLPMNQSYTSAQLKRINGVKIYLLLRKGDEWKELTSFTNVRNAQTIGATIAEGSVLPMPSPRAIKSFSLGDFSGLQSDGIVEFVVKTDSGRPRWKMRLEFAPMMDDANRILLRRFQIEAPPGTVLASGILNQPVAREEYVNMLALDRSGLYDYDLDPDVSGQLVVKGSNPFVEVTRMDFDAASLFIRP